MLIKRKSIEREEARRRPRTLQHPPATITEYDGVRYLHLGTEWIQGAMRIRKPHAIEIEYTQQMMMWVLFNPSPRHIVQLGLGAGALTKFCYRQFPSARVTAIELNANVIALCQEKFKLPPNDARLNVIEMDALAFVNDPTNRGCIDVLQVDLYDAQAHSPVLNNRAFYQACATCLTDKGMMTVNLFGTQLNHARSLRAIHQAFDAVVWLPEVHGSNTVALAFKHAPQIDFSVLDERAQSIRQLMKLPGETWVEGLKAWMMSE